VFTSFGATKGFSGAIVEVVVVVVAACFSPDFATTGTVVVVVPTVVAVFTTATSAWPCVTVAPGDAATAAAVNVNVAVTDSTEYVSSAAFVIVNEQVPAVFAVTTPEVIVQVAVPVVTTDVVAPVPEPPVVATMMPVTKSPEVVDTARADCVFFANVTVVESNVSTR
jgi:hypothetical protein